MTAIPYRPTTTRQGSPIPCPDCATRGWMPAVFVSARPAPDPRYSRKSRPRFKPNSEQAWHVWTTYSADTGTCRKLGNRNLQAFAKVAPFCARGNLPQNDQTRVDARTYVVQTETAHVATACTAIRGTNALSVANTEQVSKNYRQALRGHFHLRGRMLRGRN